MFRVGNCVTGSVAIAAAVVLGMGLVGSDTARADSATSSESCLPGELKSVLRQLREEFGRMRVVSTYRPGARIAGSGHKSHHADCEAVDFVPPDGKYDRVVNWLHEHHGGGVGTYSCMDHIHVDNGSQMHWEKCR